MKTYENGRFGGLLDSSQHINLFKILHWKLFKKSSQPLALIIPLDVVDQSQKLTQEDDFVCWLGHASFLIQLGGKRIIIDPVFGDIPFYKRQIKAPYTPQMLGKIDLMLLSHTHYDHFDVPSIEALQHNGIHAVVPLKMASLLHETASSMPVHELDWYETYREEGLSITLTPARHWGRRGLFDKNRVLWGGFILQYKEHTLYFAGDSAAGDHFEAIGERFNIDLALMPIGAYKPEFIMKYNHLNPQEAYDAFEALGAKQMVPLHYGTFKLTDEPLDEPLAWMEKIAALHSGKVLFLKPGEVQML